MGDVPIGVGGMVEIPGIVCRDASPPAGTGEAAARKGSMNVARTQSEPTHRWALSNEPRPLGHNKMYVLAQTGEQGHLKRRPDISH